MREIKFRGWNKVAKTMGDPFTLQVAIGSRKWEGVETSEVEYMQFTGVLDKNGKEIYEGDILIDHDISPDRDNKRVIKNFLQSSFWIYEDIFNTGKNPYEVVGNLYENPELLNQAQSLVRLGK